MFAVSNTRTAASANRAPPRAHTSDESGMVDRRRWTSFLTWAFVLAEMAGRDGLLPAAAHAGEEPLAASGLGSDTAAPIANNLPNISVSTATESPEPITYQHAPTMPEYASTQLSTELGAAKIAPATDTLTPDVGVGGGGGHGFATADASADAAAPGEPLLVAFNPAGEMLDLGLNFDLSDTAHNLLGGLADGLGSLPLVGGLLEDVGHTLAGTAGGLLSSLEPVVSLVGIDSGSAPASSLDLGSPGMLSFDGAPAAHHELATPGGGYTTYGIALNIGGSDPGHAAIDDALTTSGLDSLAFDHFDHGASSDALHLDQAVLKTASDILA